MPLSDEERRTLAAMERAISQDDPHFADAVSIDHQQRLQRRRFVRAAALVVSGAVLLVAGLVTTHTLLTVGVMISLTGALNWAAAIWLATRLPQRPDRGPRALSVHQGRAVSRSRRTSWRRGLS